MLPEFGARPPFQLRLVTCTFVPLQVQLPFQLLVVTDSVLDGKENASVQPLIAFGPVLVIVRLATKPLPHPSDTSYVTAQVLWAGVPVVNRTGADGTDW